jgi:hypothetical protein
MRKLLHVLLFLGLIDLGLVSCVTKSEMQTKIAEAEKRGYDSAISTTEIELQALRAIAEFVKKRPKNFGPIGHTHDTYSTLLKVNPDSVPPGGTLTFIEKVPHDAGDHTQVKEYLYFVNNRGLKVKQLQKLLTSAPSHAHEKIEVIDFEIPDPVTGQPSGVFARVAYFK